MHQKSKTEAMIRSWHKRCSKSAVWRFGLIRKAYLKSKSFTRLSLGVIRNDAESTIFNGFIDFIDEGALFAQRLPLYRFHPKLNDARYHIFRSKKDSMRIIAKCARDVLLYHSRLAASNYRVKRGDYATDGDYYAVDMSIMVKVRPYDLSDLYIKKRYIGICHEANELHTTEIKRLSRMIYAEHARLNAKRKRHSRYLYGSETPDVATDVEARFAIRALRKEVERLGLKDNRRTFPAKQRYHLLKQAGGKCSLCGASASDTHLHVDHIHPYSKGGLTIMENAQVLCAQCNIGKGAAA